jgi:hypothetical protein
VEIVLRTAEDALRTAEDTVVLFSGTPAGGYAFKNWLPGTIVEDRYALRLPREMADGTRILQFSIIDSANDKETIELTALEVLPVTRAFTPPDLKFTTDAEFGSSVRLLGYNLDTNPVGETVDATLYWQSVEPIDQDYVVFFHLVDPASGKIVSQVDEQPLRGERPTSTWVRGEIIADTHSLDVPGLRPGNRYIMRTGLYIPLTGAYLMVDEAREFSVEIKIP